MKLTNKQAANVTLGVGANTVYLPKVAAQIRALTLHNPTIDPVGISVSINGKVFVNKTLATNTTEVISSLFNQQVQKDEPVTATGEGVNLILTVVEITE